MLLCCSVMSNSLRPHGPQPTRFLYPWNFSGMDTGVGFHSLLQGIFQTQGSNLSILKEINLDYTLEGLMLKLNL